MRKSRLSHKNLRMAIFPKDYRFVSWKQWKKLKNVNLLTNFSRQVAHHGAFVLMDSIASHCFANYVFVNTFRLKVEYGSNNLVLGNCDQFPTNGDI